MAVSNERVIGYELVKGSITSNLFAAFLRRTDFGNRKYVLMDNAAIHKTKHVSQCMQEKGLDALFLSLYSPEYQPIENVFSVVKAYFRRLRPSCSYLPVDDEDNMQLRVLQCIEMVRADELCRTFASCWERAASTTQAGECHKDAPCVQ